MAAKDDSVDWAALDLGGTGTVLNLRDDDGDMIRVLRDGARDPAADAADAGRRTAGSHQEASVAMSMPSQHDVLARVLEYVGPRELYQMANACRFLRAEVALPLVVQCGMTSRDGNVRRTMDIILELMRRGSIWIPSPLRLLRLMNGRRCEFCDAHRVAVVHGVYGVFACRACLAQDEDEGPRGTDDAALRPGRLVHEWEWLCDARGKFNAGRDRYCLMAPVFKHPRVTCVVERRTIDRLRMWARPTVDAAGERIGPLVTLAHFVAMCDSVYERRTFSAADRYMKATIGALDVREYGEYIAAYGNAREQAETYQRERALNKERARELRNKKIQDKVTKMIQDITALLPPSRRAALRHSREDVRDAWRRDCVDFADEGARAILKPHIRSAAKLSRRTLKGLATAIEALCTGDPTAHRLRRAGRIESGR